MGENSNVLYYVLPFCYCKLIMCLIIFQQLHCLHYLACGVLVHVIRDVEKLEVFGFRAILHWIWAYFYAVLGYFNIDGYIWGFEPRNPLNMPMHVISSNCWDDNACVICFVFAAVVCFVYTLFHSGDDSLIVTIYASVGGGGWLLWRPDYCPKLFSIVYSYCELCDSGTFLSVNVSFWDVIL